MAQADLIDEHVSLKQCQTAVDALLKHETKRQEKLEESQLSLGKEQNVWLVLTVKQMHPEKKVKPHKIPIVHPLVDPRSSAVCLITKDPQREYKDLLEQHKIKFISRVVGVEKLKGKFKAFEARRLLLKENDLFLADERVVPLLPKLLGKKFFDAKKQPVPVNLTRKDLKGELERAISSTYFHQNQGTCSSIKVGTLSQTPAQVLANLQTALPAIVKAVKGGWDNIQSLNIKTNSSASLPIWSCELGADEGARWDGLVHVESEVSDQEAGGEEDAQESDAPKETTITTKAKGKKRAAEEDDTTEGPQPKKKSKASKAAPVQAPVTQPSERKKTQKRTPAEAVAPSPSSSPDKSTKMADTQPSTASPLPPPTSGALKKKQKARAQATDFFNDAQEISSATKLVAKAPAHDSQAPPLPAASKKAKSAVQALSAGVSEGEGKSKKAKHKKKADVPQEAAIDTEQPSSTAPPATATPHVAGNAAEGEKKKRKKAREEVAPNPVASAVTKPSDSHATLSIDEIKQKRGANSGVEKKKEKLVKGKRSAKDALIGKKGL